MSLLFLIKGIPPYWGKQVKTAKREFLQAFFQNDTCVEIFFLLTPRETVCQCLLLIHFIGQELFIHSLSVRLSCKNTIRASKRFDQRYEIWTSHIPNLGTRLALVQHKCNPKVYQPCRYFVKFTMRTQPQPRCNPLLNGMLKSALTFSVHPWSSWTPNR